MDSIGQLAALGAAAAWAMSTVIYRRLGAAAPPLTLNLLKGAISIPLLVATLALWPDADTPPATTSLLLLAISGAIGIGVGDSAFFAALNRLGERRTILMAETLAPPLAAALALVAIGETLPPIAVAGIVLTVLGVAWVVGERSPTTPIDRRALAIGSAYGLLAAACQAGGAVLSRKALIETEISPVLSSLVRIGAGVAVLLVWIPLARGSYLPPPPRTAAFWKGLLTATLLGTFLGLCLQQVALQHTSAGVTQTLIATSSLMVLPIVALGGEKIGRRAVVGAVIAVVGVGALLLS